MKAQRVYIDGIQQPIVAERLDRGEAGGPATLEHPLPFLAIGTCVADEAGHTYTIDRVELEMRKGIPRLVIGLEPEVSEVHTLDSIPTRKQATIAFERPRIDDAVATVREVVVGGERHAETSPMHDRDSLLALLQPSAEPVQPASDPAPALARRDLAAIPAFTPPPAAPPASPFPATASASTRLLLSAPPALHTGTTMELERPAYLRHRTETVLSRIWAELKSVVQELAVELGLRREPKRLPR